MRLWSWSLSRSPLAPSVPLDGSETVAGLRILERMRLTEALEGPAGSGAAGAGGGRQRRAFVRYKGPFIEQLVAEDLRADPKPWRTFWQGECGEWQQAYNLPANTDVLRERVEVSGGAGLGLLPLVKPGLRSLLQPPSHPGSSRPGSCPADLPTSHGQGSQGGQGWAGGA